MNVEPTVLVISSADVPKGLVQELEKTEVFVEGATWSEFGRVLGVVAPDLVLLVGHEHATDIVRELARLPEPERVRLAIVAERDALGSLRQLDRDIVVSILSLDIAEAALAARLSTVAKRLAQRAVERARSVPPPSASAPQHVAVEAPFVATPGTDAGARPALLSQGFAARAPRRELPGPPRPGALGSRVTSEPAPPAPLVLARALPLGDALPSIEDDVHDRPTLVKESPYVDDEDDDRPTLVHEPADGPARGEGGSVASPGLSLEVAAAPLPAAGVPAPSGAVPPSPQVVPAPPRADVVRVDDSAAAVVAPAGVPNARPSTSRRGASLWIGGVALAVLSAVPVAYFVSPPTRSWLDEFVGAGDAETSTERPGALGTVVPPPAANPASVPKASPPPAAATAAAAALATTEPTTSAGPTPTGGSLWVFPADRAKSCTELATPPAEITGVTLTIGSRAWERARGMLVRGDLAGAHRALCEAVQNHPQSLALEGLVEHYLSMHDPESARPWLEQALTHRGERSKTLELLGELESQLGHEAEARAAWARALGVAASDTETLAKVSKMLAVDSDLALRAGELVRAEGLARRAATLDSASALGRVRMAAAYLARNFPQGAELWLARAFEADANSPEALLVRGDLELSRGEREKARATYLMASEAPSTTRAAWQRLSTLPAN